MQLVGLVLAGALALPTPSELPPLARLMYTAQPVYCGGTHGRRFALTFDDGPGPYTLRLVKVLRETDARATFFLVGSRAGIWPAAVRALSRVGSVGNHTWSHPHLAALSPSAARAELLQTQRILTRLTNATPRVFRPPYEQATAGDDRIARALALVDVRWSVDGGDSLPGARPQAVVRTVRAGLRPGAIVLLHDLHPSTAAVTRAVLRTAARRGLQAVTVEELLTRQPPSAKQLSSTGRARCPS